MDTIVEDFLTECRECLDSFDRELPSLGAQGLTDEKIATLVRSVHTMKGTSGFLGFPHIERVTKSAERLLLQLREGRTPLAQELETPLRATSLALRHMLDEIEKNGCDGENDYPDLLAHLDRLAGAAPTASE